MITYEKYAEYRDERKMKDADVAKKAEIPPSTFSDWKKGRCTPKIDKMQRIAAALGMDYSAFIGPVGFFSSYNPDNPLHIEVESKIEIPDQLPDRILAYAKKIAELSEDGQEKVLEYIDLVKKAGD